MEIQTVKKQKNGYLINGTITVVDGYSGWMLEPLNEWLANNEPEPEFTEEELQITSINKQIQEAKAYLASTDFYMTVDKYSELDEARKVELTTKRAEAREVINTLEAELTTIGGN